MKTILLFATAILLSISAVYAQESEKTDSSVYLSNNSSSDTLIINQLFYNGSIWQGKYFAVYGTEFFLEDKWFNAEISVNGVLFNDTEVKYDIYNDDLLVNYRNENIIKLNKSNIDSFSITDENKAYSFKKDVGTDQMQEFYQVLFEGNKCRFYKKWKKDRVQFAIEAKWDEFQDDSYLLLIVNDEPYQFRRKRSLIKIMSDRKKEIRSFIRKNKIKVDINNPVNIVPVIKYYNSI